MDWLLDPLQFGFITRALIAAVLVGEVFLGKLTFVSLSQHCVAVK